MEDGLRVSIPVGVNMGGPAFGTMHPTQKEPSMRLAKQTASEEKRKNQFATAIFGLTISLDHFGAFRRPALPWGGSPSFSLHIKSLCEVTMANWGDCAMVVFDVD